MSNIDCKKICKKKPKEDCIKLKECIYTKGTKRQFCRLKYNKMDENCDRIERGERKKTKTIKVTKEQKRKINEIKERNKMMEMEKEKEKREKDKKTRAREIIGRFMKKTKHRRKAMFLRAVCLDSGVCLAFGTYANEIKKHFGGFVNFEYAKAPIKRIGVPSQNGFINEIQYEHRGYKSYAILKSSMKKNADNLMYEYSVGQYVNKLNKQFPCFLETYGLYTYNNDIKINTKTVWTFVKDSKLTANMDILNKGLKLHKKEDYKIGCIKSKNLAILIQHIKGIKSLKSMLSDVNFVEKELMNILFQVYMPLMCVASTFTHYDLHYDNVNIYEPVKDSFIQFHYHVSGEVYLFKSKYIAKIIDYGRSYFKDVDNNMDSKKIYNDLCKKYACKPGCGMLSGFSWLTDYKSNKEGETSYWISSQRNNQSHDLRLINEVNNSTKSYNTQSALSTGMKYLLQVYNYEKHYGTPELLTSEYPTKLNNVTDVYKLLAYYMNSPNQIQRNDKLYEYKTKLGDLHIYDDGRSMQFKKA